MSVLKVKDYCTENPICISRNTSLREISEIILEKKYSVLPVIEDNKCIGVVTIAELMSVFIPEYLDLFENIGFAANLDFELEISSFIDELIIAEDIIRKDIPRVTPETNLIIAVALLNKHHINGVPVLKDDKVVGIITIKDICSALICYKNNSSFDAI